MASLFKRKMLNQNLQRYDSRQTDLLRGYLLLFVLLKFLQFANNS